MGTTRVGVAPIPALARHNARVPSELELVGRLVLAAVVAGVLGIERELHEQPAGFRTHMLVGLGAALFSVISAFGFQHIAGLGPQREIRADITRTISQIVVGIGFLGGGAIIKYGASVRGLTTAASLWVVASVGTAIGLGLYLLGAVAAGLALLALAVLRPLGSVIRRYATSHAELIVELEPRGSLAAVTTRLRGADITVGHVELEGSDSDTRTYVLVVRLPRGVGPERAVDALSDEPSVRHADWAR
jgi:putative Mg2+ transporter-C (MgtC) family protein